jgi:hypothetical protein
MVYQSNIRLAAGEKPKVEKVKEGVFVIANAYEGSYEYFRPSKPAPPQTPPQSNVPVEKK